MVGSNIVLDLYTVIKFVTSKQQMLGPTSHASVGQIDERSGQLSRALQPSVDVPTECELILGCSAIRHHCAG